MFGHFTYLGLELLWGAPVVTVQWVIGFPALRRWIKLLVLAVLIPTGYLSAADSLAIHRGIWTLHTSRITGIHFGNVPLEEVLFFVITNLMIVQTIILVILSPEVVHRRLVAAKAGLRGWIASQSGAAQDSSAP